MGVSNVEKGVWDYSRSTKVVPVSIVYVNFYTRFVSFFCS